MPSIKSKINTFRTFPADTMWYVYLGNKYTRGSDLDMAAGEGNLIDNAKKLEMICAD
ncbi:hypothetical protein AB9P05_20980 [Roseivirga sp. BDSF3-8]|uniref:hypothetical protein n=1 Tax=Roseivirga sp. BDSF3-8 TaxID=3241598 RepID=UPI0035327554